MNKDEAAAFAANLADLAGESRRADRAAVKRARTGHVTQRLLARRVHHRLVPAGVAHTDRTMRLVERATSLFVLNPLTSDGSGGLGRALRALAQRPDVSPEAVERRFTALLAAGPDTLDTHLARLFTRLNAAGIGLDYAQLTWHLQGLDHPERWVQRRWADEFWGPQTEPDDATAPQNGVTA